MSYPWWRFEVTFRDGHVGQFQATGFDTTDAMEELLRGFGSWESMDTNSLYGHIRQHGEIVKVEYKGCLTYGIEEASSGYDLGGTAGDADGDGGRPDDQGL